MARSWKINIPDVLRLLRQHRIPKTFILIAGQVAMMVFWQLTRASISSMRIQVGSSLDDVVFSILARGVAYLVGVLLGAAATDLAQHLSDLLLAACYFTAALAAVTTAWTTDLLLLVIALFLNGFVIGGSSILNISSIMRSWKVQSTLPIYALHLAFGASTQFAYTNNIEFYSREDALWTHANWTKIIHLSDYPHAPDVDATLTVPSATWWGTILTTLGVIYFLLSVFFLWAHLDESVCSASSRRHASVVSAEAILKQFAGKIDDDEEVVQHMTNKQKRICLGILSVCFLLISGSERILSTQFYGWSLQMGFNADKAVSLNILFWKCFMSGRFVWLVLSIMTNQFTVLGMSTVLTFIMALLIIVLDDSYTLLWWGMALLGFGLSAATPGLLSWFNTRVDMRGGTVALLYFSSALGSILYQFIIPSIIQSLSTNPTMFVPLINTIILFVLFAGLAAFDRTVMLSYRGKCIKIYESIKEDFSGKNTDDVCQYNCGFTTIDIKELRQHLHECPNLPES